MSLPTQPRVYGYPTIGAVQYIADFEDLVTEKTNREEVDGTLELLRANRDRNRPTPGAVHLQGNGVRTEPLIEENEAAVYII